MGILTREQFSDLITDLENDHDPNYEGKTTEEIKILTAVEDYLIQNKLDAVDMEMTLNFNGSCRMRFKGLVVNEGGQDDDLPYYVERENNV